MNHTEFAWLPVFCIDLGKWQWFKTIYFHMEPAPAPYCDGRYFYTSKPIAKWPGDPDEEYLFSGVLDNFKTDKVEVLLTFKDGEQVKVILEAHVWKLWQTEMKSPLSKVCSSVKATDYFVGG